MRFWFLRWFLVRDGYLSGLDMVSTFFNLKKDSFPIFKETLSVTFQIKNFKN